MANLRMLRFKVTDIIRGVPAVSLLCLLLALLRPRRVPMFLASTLRSFELALDRRLPAKTPEELLDDRRPVGIRLGEQGVFPYTEADLLVVQLAATLRPERVFEIGTFRGRMAALIAMNCPDSTRVYTLDLPPEAVLPEFASDVHYIEAARRDVGLMFRDTPWNGTKIIQLLGNSKTFDFSPYYDAMDLVEVDASHTYEFVFNDSMKAFRMVRPGGVILWHDYESMRSEYGVTRFVDRLHKVHGCPAYRLAHVGADTRYAVMRVDAACKQKLEQLARQPGNF